MPVVTTGGGSGGGEDISMKSSHILGYPLNQINRCIQTQYQGADWVIKRLQTKSTMTSDIHYVCVSDY